MAYLVNNGGVSTLASGITTPTQTSIVLYAGHGVRFPSPTGGDYTLVTLENAAGTIEIVSIVGRTADTMTVGIAGSTTADSAGRGLEGTTKTTWLTGDIIEGRATAAIVSRGGNAKTTAELAATTGAALIGNTPAGNIAATTVQAALNELDAEKALLAGSSTQPFAASTGTFTGAVTGATGSFVNSTNGVLLAEGSAGYGGVTAKGSGTNSAYLFLYGAAGEYARVEGASPNLLRFYGGGTATYYGGFSPTGLDVAGKGTFSNTLSALASIEIGKVDGGTGTPYLDFHSGATVLDYDTRIISDTPTGVLGGGKLTYTANGGHVFNGSVTSNAGLIATAGAFSGSILSSSPTGGIGYGTGAGGTVTQLTSKSTAVTLDKLCGTIQVNAAALAAATTVTFLLSNASLSFVGNDIDNLSISCSGGTIGAYQCTVGNISNGSAYISIRNVTAGSLSEGLAIIFTVLKGRNI